MSLITIKVTPWAKENAVTETNGEISVRVTAPAKNGLANAAVLKLLAEYWRVPPSSLSIVRGYTARQKVISRP